MTAKDSPEFRKALGQLAHDPEVRAIWEKGVAFDETLLNQFGRDSDRDGSLASRMKAFIIDQARRVEAAQRDKGREHFSVSDLELLRVHPHGEALVRRMAEGDVTAVPEARSLLSTVIAERRQLDLGS